MRIASRRTLWVALAVVVAIAVPLIAMAATEPAVPATPWSGGAGWGGMMGGNGNNMLQWHAIGQAAHQRELEAAASVLGTTADDLTRELYANGASIEALAAARGATLDAVMAAAATARGSYFDELAQSGAIPADQLTWMKQMWDWMGPSSLYGGAMMASGACH